MASHGPGHRQEESGDHPNRGEEGQGLLPAGVPVDGEHVRDRHGSDPRRPGCGRGAPASRPPRPCSRRRVPIEAVRVQVRAGLVHDPDGPVREVRRRLPEGHGGARVCEAISPLRRTCVTGREWCGAEKPTAYSFSALPRSLRIEPRTLRSSVIVYTTGGTNESVSSHSWSCFTLVE